MKVVLLVVTTGVSCALHLLFHTVCVNVHMPIAGVHGTIRLGIKSMADGRVCYSVPVTAGKISKVPVSLNKYLTQDFPKLLLCWWMDLS